MMYDIVTYVDICDKCGDLVDEFHSKDGACILDFISPDFVDNFYSQCEKCGWKIEFKRIDEENWLRNNVKLKLKTIAGGVANER